VAHQDQPAPQSHLQNRLQNQPAPQNLPKELKIPFFLHYSRLAAKKTPLILIFLVELL